MTLIVLVIYGNYYDEKCIAFNCLEEKNVTTEDTCATLKKST